MTVVAAHGEVQAALVEVLLRRVQATVGGRALNRRVLAVQHDMVVHVDAVVDPRAARPAVGAAHDQLVQHSLDDLGDRAQVARGLDGAAAGRAGLDGLLLGGPGVLEALAAEEVLAGQLDGAVEGGVADQTHQVRVGVGRVFEGGHLGGHFEASALAALRRG